MKNQYLLLRRLSAFFCFLLITTNLFAGSRTWTGSISTDWSVAGNWSGGLPGSGDDVTIPGSPAGGRMPVFSNGNSQVKSITMESGATLTITGGTLLSSGANSSIGGNLTLSGGILLIGNNLKIETGGVLNVAGSGLLHMSTNSGDDPSDNITVDENGSINLTDGTINTKDITTNTGTPGGSINQTGGLFRVYHDFKNKGIFYATGGTIEFTGTAGGGSFPTDVTTSNTQFCNVLIDPAAVPKFGTNAVTSFNVCGNWTNNSTAVDLDNKANTTVFNGPGSQTIGGAQSTTFRNLVVNKTAGTVMLARNQYINSGNLTISSGTLDLDGYTLNRVSSGGTFTISNGGIFKLGNNSGGQSGSNFPLNFSSFSFDPASNVEYDATTTQTVFSGVNYGNLTLSNGPKTAGGQVNVNGVFTLNAAILTTTSANILVLNDNATTTGAAFNAYVNGPVKKIGNDAFSFPVGKTGSGYMNISISAPSLVTDAFTAEYIRSSATALGLVTSAGLKRVSNCDYWNLSRNSGSAAVNVTLAWNGYTNCNIAAYINDLSSLTVAHFNGSSWDTHGKDAISGNASAGSVTRNNVSVFSPFSIGTTDEFSNPLSVEFNPANPLDPHSANKKFVLYPVPVQAGPVILQCAKLSRGNYTVKITGIMGETVKSVPYLHPGGSFKQEILLPATIKPGMYQIQVLHDGLTVSNTRFVVQ